MKKNTIFIAALFSSAFAFAQVGVNTESPQATLDVVGKPADATSLDGMIAPRITGDQLRAKAYTANQTGALVYVTAADTAPAGQTIDVTSVGYFYFDGTKWVKQSSGSGTFTEVDGIIGNEVLDGTPNGGLVRAGAGTNLNPFTLGLTNGTTAGDLMTWNGTAWLPTPAVNIYTANGSLTGTGTARTLTLNGKTLNFTGTGQRTSWGATGVLFQENSSGAGTSAAISLNGGGGANLWIQQFNNSDGRVQAQNNATSLVLSTSGTTVSAPISMVTSAGSGALGTEKMRITGTGNVGVATDSPTEKFDNNGITRLRSLPLNGTANAINTTPGGATSPTQNQTFTATRTVVVDANGVLGYVNGLPSTTASTGTLEVGQETVWTGSTAANVAATAGQLNQATAYLSNYNGNASTLPVVEGLRLDANFPNADSVQPRFVNTSTGNVKVHYSSEAPNQGVGAANVVLGASNYMVVGSSSGISATRGANQVSTGTGADYSGAGSSIESMKINLMINNRIYVINYIPYVDNNETTATADDIRVVNIWVKRIK